MFAEEQEQEQHLSVNYSEFIDNPQLKAYVSEHNLVLGADLENNIKALNSAAIIVYFRDEYRGLLARVGITELTEDELVIIEDENNAMRLQILGQEARIVLLFEGLYMALRRADKEAKRESLSPMMLRTTNYVQNTLSRYNESGEKYKLLRDNVKKSILADIPRRSVDAWYLMQDVLRGRYPLNMLAMAIYNITHSGTRRASLPGSVDTRRPNSIKNIETSLGQLSALLTARPCSVSPPAVFANEAEAMAAILALYDFTSYEAWLPETLVLAIGSKIVVALEEALLGGNHKEKRVKPFNDWKNALLTEMYRYLALENIGMTSAIGLYYFQKELDPNYQPLAAMLQALATATHRDPTRVLHYLNGFMVSGGSAREAHAALVMSQLGLMELPAILAKSKYSEDIRNLWQAFANLVVLSQTPLAVLMVAEPMARVRAKALSRVSAVSALDLEFNTTTQVIRQKLTDLRAKKKNETCQESMKLNETEVMNDMNSMVTKLGIKQLQVVIKQKNKENATLLEENTQLQQENAALRAELATLQAQLNARFATPPAVSAPTTPSQKRSSKSFGRLFGPPTPARPVTPVRSVTPGKSGNDMPT